MALPSKFSVALPVQVVASGGILVRQVDTNGVALDDSTDSYGVALPVVPVDGSGVTEDGLRTFSTWNKVTLDPNGFPVVRTDPLGISVSTDLLGGTVTLTPLVLSNTTFPENSSPGFVIANISGTRVGSTLSLSDNALNKVALSGNQLVVGATNADFEATPTFNITVVETLAGAVGSPNSTTFTLNVSNVFEAASLGTLTFSSAAFQIGTPSSGTINGATAGSTITASGLPTGVTINGAARTWAYDGTGTTTAGTITLTETLADSANSPKTSTISFTVGDTVAPTLSSPVGTQTGTTTATVGATTNEGNGTLYYVISLLATAPTAVKIEAGNDVSGPAINGSQAISSTGAKTFSVTGLTGGTTYYAHLMHKDAAGNRSNVVSSTAFVTTSASSLATPTLSLFSATGAIPVQFSVSDTDYVAGFFGQLQIATDSGFTTITQDTGAVFLSGDAWSRLDATFGYTDPSGTYYARFRMLRDNENGTTTVALPAGGSATFDASAWSNTVTDTISTSVAALNTVSGVNMSHYLSSVTGSSNKGWYMNTNDGGLAMVRATLPAGSNFTQSAARIDGYFASGTQFHCGMIDGTRNLDSPASTFSYPGTGAAGTAQKGFTFEVYKLDTHLGIYRNNGTQSIVLPFAMTIGDYVVWTLNKTTKVVNVYAYQAPANGSNGLTGLLNSFTVDTDHIPADDYYFFGGGQKGNAGDPTTSDGGTFFPESATIRAYDSGCTFYA